uniref:Uncharacterized protein n=1 Tax=Solanum lycopersicum TaxID=4081 RepID=A0A3Q7J2Q5_SOLLC
MAPSQNCVEGIKETPGENWGKIEQEEEEEWRCVVELIIFLLPSLADSSFFLPNPCRQNTVADMVLHVQIGSNSITV